MRVDIEKCADNDCIQITLEPYYRFAKSPQKARTLNALLTGIGYHPLKMYYPFVLLCVLLSIHSLSATPWGTDADLCIPAQSAPSEPPSNSLLARLGACVIRFHQEVISPADGPRSHFIPSSSQYTLEAIRTYGFCAGMTYGCDRLMRENDEEWVYKKIKDPHGKLMKWNPIPNPKP